METVRPTTFRSCFIPWSIDSDVLAAPKSVREAVSCDDTWRGQSFVLILLNRNHPTPSYVRWCCANVYIPSGLEIRFTNLFSSSRCTLDFFSTSFSIRWFIRSLLVIWKVKIRWWWILTYFEYWQIGGNRFLMTVWCKVDIVRYYSVL